MKKSRLTKSLFTLGAADADLGEDPNAYPHALTQAHAESAAVVCQFLGHTFHKDDKICYQGAVWKCTAGGWEKTGTQC